MIAPIRAPTTHEKEVCDPPVRHDAAHLQHNDHNEHGDNHGENDSHTQLGAFLRAT